MDINREINSKAAEIEEIIKGYLPKEEGYQKTVLEAMNYSILAGGKRLRPMLMQETYRLFGGKGKIVEPFMAAMEMIHTYSLVHDDLPAMDNDEYRRGRKTTHVVYGEGMAVLAGDGLLNYAFETAMRAFDSCEVDGIKVADRYAAVGKALQVLAKKAGIYGMIGGQTADIEAEDSKEPLTTEQLLFIHEHKTAALIQASMMIGAILAGAGEKAVEDMEKCAYNIGIAFQIQDDILDVIGDEQVLGKPVGSDEKNSKQTYVTIHGMEKAKEDVAKLSKEATAIIESVGGDGEFLKALILQLIHREK
ncbi:MAG: polyprenyl synthetase family protein [Lachnospiraceae bacterium]|nr:polyprenyl synthetase family protein [Lachnospiraceae bacterium]